MLHLSALDQSPVRSGGSPADAVQETLRLAQTVEQLGYRRFWLAEHHGFGFDAAHSPAYDTESVDHRRMRVGAHECVRICQPRALVLSAVDHRLTLKS